MADSNADLLRLAAKANQIATRLNRENENSRLVGRLARAPHDLDAFARATLQEAKEHGLLSEHLETGNGLLLLQLALARVSELCWEDLWNDAHPDQFGQARGHDDSQLRSVWRKEVRELIQDCHQEWLLTVDGPAEYKKTLIEAGAGDEIADELVDWLSNVRTE